jgi:putative membrane protein
LSGSAPDEGAAVPGVVADRRLHPATLIGRTLRVIPEAAGGLVAYGAFIAKAEAAQLAGFVLLGLAASAGIAFLMWWRFHYGVGEREIVIESGVIRRRRRVIPFERVQDIAIEQRLVARLFGTAHVKIETGGSAADEGHLDSIALADAHRLRDHIRGRVAATASAAAEAAAAVPAAAGAEPVLFAMDLGRVALSGTFNFSLVFVAAIGAIVQNVEELGFWRPEDFRSDAVDRWQEAWLAASVALALIVLLLGFAAGVVRTVARDYGFTLTRAPTGLRRRRGLLTLSETVIPIRRMQLAQIGSGLFMRLFGWHRLDFQTLGADRKGQGAQVAAPFARMDEIAPILAETGFPDPASAGAWRRGPARAILRRAILPLVTGLAAAAAALVLEVHTGLILAGLVLLAAATAPLRWRRHVHAVGASALFVRGGVIRHSARIMTFGRVQAIAVTQGPLQRRLRLASVRIDTAGAPAAGGLVVLDLEEAEAHALAETLLLLFRDARRAERRAA